MVPGPRLGGGRKGALQALQKRADQGPAMGGVLTMRSAVVAHHDGIRVENREMATWNECHSVARNGQGSRLDHTEYGSYFSFFDLARHRGMLQTKTVLPLLWCESVTQLVGSTTAPSTKGPINDSRSLRRIPQGWYTAKKRSEIKPC